MDPLEPKKPGEALSTDILARVRAGAQRAANSGKSAEQMLTEHRAMMAGRGAAWEQQQLLGARAFLARCGAGDLEIAYALSELPADPLRPAEPAIGFVDNFLARPELRTLVLWGGVGAGKSVGGVWWLFRRARVPVDNDDVGRSWAWDQTARFVTSHQLALLNPKWRDEDRVLFEKLKRARRLVVDELGGETEDIRGLFDDLLNARNSRRWCETVITSNLACEPDPNSERPGAVSMFEERYGLRVCSRILQHGIFLGCGNLDLRQLKPTAAPVQP